MGSQKFRARRNVNCAQKINCNALSTSCGNTYPQRVYIKIELKQMLAAGNHASVEFNAVLPMRRRLIAMGSQYCLATCTLTQNAHIKIDSKMAPENEVAV